MADPGEGYGGSGRPPLFLDQTETRRAEKKVLETAPPTLSQGLDNRPPPPPPPYLRVWITPPPPPPLSEGLEPPLGLPLYGRSGH